jgi:hypothetical protein
MPFGFKFITPWSHATCPYCFERFHLADCPIRLVSGVPEPDVALGRFLGGPSTPPLMPLREPPAAGLARWTRKWVTWADESRIGRRVCPHCHLPVIPSVARGEIKKMRTIGLVGARSSGKSNYIGVLIKTLEQRFAREVGFEIFPEETFDLRQYTSLSSRRLHTARYGRLFEENPRAIELSRSANQERELRSPLIYRLTFPATKKRFEAEHVHLVLLDAAGEDLEQNPDEVDRLYRYLREVDGLVFLLDPLDSATIRSDLDASFPTLPNRPGVQNDPLGIVHTIVSIFEDRAGHSATSKIPIPVAFTLSKSDLLDNIVAPECRFLKPSRHPQGFRNTESKLASREIQAYLEEWSPPGEIKALSERFTKSRFFAVSALGHLPGADLKLDQAPAPRRIADPFLWLCFELGLINESVPETGEEA